LALGRRLFRLREAGWEPPRPRQDVVDLEVQVRLDHHAVDEEADQTLPRGEVRVRHAVPHLANQVRQLRPEAAAHVFVAQRALCLLQV
jgi:hypothetical protein